MHDVYISYRSACLEPERLCTLRKSVRLRAGAVGRSPSSLDPQSNVDMLGGSCGDERESVL